jgi:hypothetical protein
VYPQIYLGIVPETTAERLALRALALELRARLGAARNDVPSTLLLHFAPAPGAAPADLLLLQPGAAIVGAVRSYAGPIVAQPGGRWAMRDSGAPLAEAGGTTPIQFVDAQRNAVRDRLDDAAPALLGTLPEAQPFARMVGALICTPITHPDSHISLTISDHRRQLKVLGLDELPAVAGMLRLGTQLAPEAMHTIVTELFGGRLWHDGARFLFELAAPRFQLRVLASGTRSAKVLQLMEGENLIGRRRAPQQHERRLTLGGDELISADHAIFTVGDGEQVLVRDTSKNGTWVAAAGGAEERVRRERSISPGDELRLGITRLRLERVEGAEDSKE